MSKGKSEKIVYKPYEQNQAYLIPPSAEELIPENHLVRLVSEVIDEMGIAEILRKYRVGGGASRYHPEMMTKLFVYGYMTKVCSSRYTFVWKKSVEKNDKKLDEKLRAYIRMADAIWEDENQEYRERDLEELGGKEGYTSKDVKELAGVLRERIEHLETDGEEERKKKLKKELKTVETDYLVRKKRYEKAKRVCGKRNSYSKTDPDATFMRMKEDRMGNGQLKPGYNVQIGTENNFVTGYDIFPNPTDTRTLKPHLKRQKKRFGMSPQVVIADAGYGSEENYEYLENQKSVAVIKYSMFRKERTRKWKEDIWKTDNWQYNAEGRYYVCPNGKHLTWRKTYKRRTDAGYLITVDQYECESCKYCRLKKRCTKAKGNRRIERNENWLRLKAQAKKILENEPYKELRKQRGVEVETVFGQIKGNQGYRRFLLRGNAKVAAEWGLLSLGYDLKQLYRVMK
jgi:transposase